MLWYYLIVPEINACLLTNEDKIIAHPNCSTIQLVMVLNPLHIKLNIKLTKPFEDPELLSYKKVLEAKKNTLVLISVLEHLREPHKILNFFTN